MSGVDEWVGRWWVGGWLESVLMGKDPSRTLAPRTKEGAMQNPAHGPSLPQVTCSSEQLQRATSAEWEQPMEVMGGS